MENGRMVDDGRTLHSSLDDSLFSSDNEEVHEPSIPL